MAYAYVRYTGNGTTASYTFPFQYLNSDHVKVYVDGVAAVFTFLNANTVTITPTPSSGQIIDIRRVTPKDTPLVNFSDGSVLLERDLDLLALFDLYIAQEAADAVDNTISTDLTGRWNAQAKRLGNLAPAINPDEAVIKQTLDYDYPAVAIAAAAKADISIVATDLGIATSLPTDLGSIADPVDSSTPPGSSNIATVASNIAAVNNVSTNMSAVTGAVTSANNAATSATAAAGSATAAASSATAASSSEANALTYKNAASTSASQAATSASNAATSAATATSQASAASGSASTASTAASNAGTSATQASSSATNAATSATNAASSANSAATSATSASGSASTATSQASAASTSASNAASSASAAATSASNAASSATAASGSASTATTQAGNAATSASSASGSATAAATSATNAASSATAASTSATNAASSASAAATSLFNFKAQYLGPLSTAPTVDGNGNAVSVGDLYFDTGVLLMKVYNGAGWQNASSSVNGTSGRFRYVATAGQTTFSGADSNSKTLSYDPGFIDVYLNGVRLDQTDYTATSGTSIVLATGATLSDELNIVAYGTFNLANFSGSNLIDNTVTVDKLTDLDLGVLP